MNRFLGPILFDLAVAGAALLGRAMRPSLESAPVPDAATPVVRAAYDPNAVQQNLIFLAAQAKRDPQDAITRGMLAHAYLERFRETGDIADARRAEQAARNSLAIRTNRNSDSMMQLSRALLAQHRFKEALQVARGAARFNPDAFRQCTDLELELGDYTQAARDLGRAPKQDNDPAYFALASRLLELHGKTAQQIAYLQLAVKQADANADMPAQSVSWFHERLGRALQMSGRLNEAEREYRAGLKVFPRDYRIMADLARLSAARNDWRGALTWGQKSAGFVPSPEIIALMGDANTALGQKKQAAAQSRLIETMSVLAKSQGVIYDRQRALYNADHNRDLDEALALARGELKVRHDIYAYDTLAWVQYKRGDLMQAQANSTRALAQGTQDATLFYHAGMIARARGQNSQAHGFLQRALAINPHFAPATPQQVRALLATLKVSGGVAAASAPNQSTTSQRATAATPSRSELSPGL